MWRLLERGEILEITLTYRVSEAARVLGVGLGTAYQLIRAKKLRSVRVGRKLLVPKIAVLEFLGNATDSID
jgi:excisionase family DNA binding protein